MTYSEIKQVHDLIERAIMKNQLGEAFSRLAKIKDVSSHAEIQERYHTLESTYRHMLKYSFEMAPDPQRQQIYRDLQQSILELSDDIIDLHIAGEGAFERKTQLKELAYIESMVYNQREQVIGVLMGKEDANSYEDESKDSTNPADAQERMARSLFIFFWLKNNYGDTEKDFFRTLLNEEGIGEDTRSLMISALSMSLMRHFDRRKFLLLFEYRDHNQIEVRQRALIGFFVNLLAYRERIILYQDIMGRIESITDEKQLQQRFMAIMLQFIRASETEKVTKKIQEEIVPEVLKIRSELEDKLKLEDLLNKESFDDKNPEWENFFKDAPDVYQKLEQFSKMQVEGADVFMGAFAMLKHFPFFRELPNWFLPFSAGNSVVQRSFEPVSGENSRVSEFVDGLENSTVMCNSDKYSFCLNINNMPEQQRTMMLDLFNMEMKAMNEAMQDELKLNAESGNKIINTQYMQDLYRFFRLHPGRKEYPEIFKTPINIVEDPVLSKLFSGKEMKRNLAEFFFSSDNYLQAAELFEALIAKEASFELYEKVGFCYQKLGQFEKAIERYRQAELFDRNKLWLQKKLGYCYRKTGEFEKAIQFYKEIVAAEPRDLNNLAYLGQLHIDTGDFEEALKYYYKVEYEDSDNLKVFRPIGWCSFVLGKYDTAIRYFKKVLEAKPNKSDFLNIGHSYWASGKISEALDAYREAVKTSGGDERWFRETFIKDSRYLKSKGIDDLDVMLMIDYILMV